MTAKEAGKQKQQAAERARKLQEREERVKTETAVLSEGTYAEVVAMRATCFAEKARSDVGFATILIGMF